MSASPTLQAGLPATAVPAHRVALVLGKEAREWRSGGGLVGFCASAALAELAAIWGGFDAAVDPGLVVKDAQAVADALVKAAAKAAAAARAG